MGRLEVQGIVSVKTGGPLVQFMQLDDNGIEITRWQVDPETAREQAQQIIEASMNAVYDAAIIGWAKEAFPDDPEMGARMLLLIRDYRSDNWGLGKHPEDWRERHFGVGGEAAEGG